ncbi:hypothetical protein PsalMR5_00263 [Piscirickettsia salmonis]|nr:hypothetical protein PsalSR1_00259 [Piscirickettsia salmonis]QGP61209.1 hypothetical protein PsalBI1_03844 [Piscirickettsia salmonis]QGP62438.1 hypothetical protein PsalMR5_00263 [Piscirickettsia salmonis]
MPITKLYQGEQEEVTHNQGAPALSASGTDI